MYINTFMICIDGNTISICLHMLFTANSSVCYWENDFLGVMFVCVDIV